MGDSATLSVETWWGLVGLVEYAMEMEDGLFQEVVCWQFFIIKTIYAITPPLPAQFSPATQAIIV